MHVRAFPLLAVAIAASIATGCGKTDYGGSNVGQFATTDTGAQAAPQPALAPPAGPAVTIGMREFAFEPQDANVQAGKVTITAANNGKTVHALTVLKTSADPAHLPLKNGQVDTSTAALEIPAVTPGAKGQGTGSLTPGRYAMVCPVPGHYQAGMFGSLTVK
jgi:uncharacterized cupredoxin-like copper-binding protein